MAVSAVSRSISEVTKPVAQLYNTSEIYMVVRTDFLGR